MTQPETDPIRRTTVLYFLQTQQPDGSWEDSSAVIDDPEYAVVRLAQRRERVPGMVCRIARHTTTVVVEPFDPDAPAGVAPAPDQTAPELTAEEARDLADELGTELYRAQDALAFVEECCVIADREGRQPTTAEVREWLKGARCGRQLAADARERTTLVDRIRRVLARCDGFDFDSLEPHEYQIQAAALAAVLPASVDRADVLREEAARIRAHCPDHLDADSAEGSWMACHCAVADDMERRVAAEVAPADTREAHPAEHTWKVESPRRGNWASWGATYDDREWAQERFESAIEHAGHRPFRLVRATTAYTVEAEHVPAAERPAAAPQPKDA